MREKIIKTMEVGKEEIVRCIMYTIVGFLMGGAKVAGVFAPFSIVISMASPINFTLFSFIGSALGIIMFGTSSSIIYLSALLFATMIKYVFKIQNPIINSIVAGLSLEIMYIITIIIAPLSIQSLIVATAESMLATSMTFLFVSGLNGIKKSKKNAAEISGIAVIAIAVILSISQIEVLGFNIGVILAATLTIIAADNFGCTGGSIVGLLTTVSLCLYTKNYALIGGVIAVSGFISGIFKPLGKLVQSFMYIGIYMLSTAFVGGLSIQGLLEVAVASIIAFMVPVKGVDRILKIKELKKKIEPKMSDDISFKLEFTAKTLLDLQENIEMCAEKLDEYSKSDILKVYNKTIDKVCKECGLKKFCYVTNYQTTKNSLDKITKILKEKGNINENSIPEFYKQKCPRLLEFITQINQCYKEYLSKEQSSKRVREAREIATEQFASMSTLLMELSNEINDYKKRDEKSEIIIEDIFDENRLEIKRVSCLIDKYGRMSIDVYMIGKIPKKTIMIITEQISKTIDREFELPSITEANGEYKISFFEEAVYKVDFYGASHSKEEMNCCGDSYDYFIDTKGFLHIILSDGMGSGKKAAIDSVMTCATLKKLLQNGFGFDSAFKLINLSFAVKSSDESLATIDICTIDLYTANAKIIKAGAATTFIKRKNEVTLFSATTLPIGIIQGVPYDCEEVKLSKGDIIVMVSDGALMYGEEWIVEELKMHSKKTAKEIAGILLNGAKRRVMDGHDDDITILVSKII